MGTAGNDGFDGGVAWARCRVTPRSQRWTLQQLSPGAAHRAAHRRDGAWKTWLSKILTRKAFGNAIKTLAAIGGSTNAVVHPTGDCRAHRRDLKLDDFELGSAMPNIVDIQPSGKHLMEDFYTRAACPSCSRPLANRCIKMRSPPTAKRSGKTCRTPENFDEKSAFARQQSVHGQCRHHHPARQSRAERWRDQAERRHGRKLLQHRGKAVVFEKPSKSCTERINDESLDIGENQRDGAQNCGERGIRAWAGWATCRCRRRCCRGHQRHGARVSDARMVHRLWHRRAARLAGNPAGEPLAFRPATGSPRHRRPQASAWKYPDADMARRKEGWTPPKPPA